MPKCTIKVNRPKLQQAIVTCEERQTFATHGELWEAVVNEYKILTNDTLTPSVVYLRVKEWNLRVKTVSGRNKAGAIDKANLQAVITEIEKGGPAENRTALFIKTAKIYAERYKLSASHSTLLTFAQKNELTILTPLGKRGGFGKGERPTGVRRSRAEKFTTNPQIQASIRQVIAVTPERFKPVAKRIAGGSMRAAVQLKCLDCTDYQTAEIRFCTCVECPLFPFRPYQNVSHGDEVAANEVVETEV